jgi:hypothetical protein
MKFADKNNFAVSEFFVFCEKGLLTLKLIVLNIVLAPFLLQQAICSV